jgi:hypothetical protein
MRRVIPLVAVLFLLSSPISRLQSQQSRAERTNYTETSTHADVIAFLDSLERAAPGQMLRGVIGNSEGGLALPYVVVSRPLVRSAAAARATGRPIVYVQGNIHGGEIEGKESLQAILRDLVRDPKANVLDSIVLVVVPIYNADGNEQFGPQERQRGSQNGPARIGQRPNGAQLDLNRDYIKVEAPETRASLTMFAAWDPDVFVDLHTTNGSFHGYALTYSPSLHPAAMVGGLAPAGAWTRDTLLPELRARVRARRNVETFDYGNFRGEFEGRDDPTKLAKGGWETYEHKPRFGSNYYGLRNRVSVLSEAYSHDPFARRVEATTAFVAELLSYVADHRPTLLARTRGASTVAVGAEVPVRAVMTRSPFNAPVLVEALEATGDSVRTESGLRPGLRRTHQFTPVTMPVYDRFDATLTRTLPHAWMLAPGHESAIERLRAHGVRMATLAAPVRVRGERFVLDSVLRAPRPFQGHQEVRVAGRWVAEWIDLPAGTIVVPADQPLALLAMILLEPVSDDGLTTWNFFDSGLAPGRIHPVRRALARIATPPAR